MIVFLTDVFQLKYSVLDWCQNSTMQLHGSNSVFDRKFGAHFNNSYVCHNKGGGALRRLRGTNFEALVLLLKIGLGG